jgi:hypothetical protein
MYMMIPQGVCILVMNFHAFIFSEIMSYYYYYYYYCYYYYYYCYYYYYYYYCCISSWQKVLVLY